MSDALRHIELVFKSAARTHPKPYEEVLGLNACDGWHLVHWEESDGVYVDWLGDVTHIDAWVELPAMDAVIARDADIRSGVGAVLPLCQRAMPHME